MERVFTSEELAERYGVAVETLTVWKYKGKGPKSFKAGKRRLYRESDVEAWEAEQVQKSA